MSLASISWFWAPYSGSRTCLRNGLPITQTDCKCPCYSCMYRIPFTLNLCKYPLVAEWAVISTLPFCRTARGGENAGDYFTNIFTLTRCTNTFLSKEKKSVFFCVDYLPHPTTFSTTFEGKHRAGYVISPRALIEMVWKSAHLLLLL